VLAGRLGSLRVAVGGLRSFWVAIGGLRSWDGHGVGLRVAIFSGCDSLGDVSGSGCASRAVDSDSCGNWRGAVLRHWNDGGRMFRSRSNRGRVLGHWSTSGVDGHVARLCRCWNIRCWASLAFAAVHGGSQSVGDVRGRQVRRVDHRVPILSDRGRARNPAVISLGNGCGDRRWVSGVAGLGGGSRCYRVTGTVRITNRARGVRISDRAWSRVSDGARGGVSWH
jgi:hypothetical protein